MRPGPRRTWIAAVLAMTFAAGACSSGAHAHRPAPGAAAAPLRVVAGPALSRRHRVALALPAAGWDVSVDVHLAGRSAIGLTLGYGGQPLRIRRGPRGASVLTVAGRSLRLRAQPGWRAGGWEHVEATNTALAVNGVRVPVPASRATQLTITLRRGRASIRALVISAAADRVALLVHRLAELHARIPLGDYPLGADLEDRLYYANSYWTSGFWPGALWEAAGFAGPVFARWALLTTLRHLGHERDDTHDVGFIYGESSLLAWRRLCRQGARPRARACARLRASVLSAANELLALAASNARAGTIPTNALGPRANTIIDSMMNIRLLTWASAVTGNPSYATLASRHAHRVAAILVRGDGSTAQSVDFDRATGAVLDIGTHQGLSNTSTWSRGEGWALYGFAQTAAAVHDAGLLRVALRIARYVAGHLTGGRVPPWDYDAPPGAPVDVSAGAVTAAGLLQLAAACRSMAHVCPHARTWAALEREVLASTLTHASSQPPLGLLGGQVLNEHGGGCWCNRGELSFGLTYALEAIAQP